MLLQVVHEVGIGIQEVKSQAPALPLEELALAITQFVTYIVGVKARVGLHVEHDKWDAAFARRGRQPLESTRDPFYPNHVAEFVRERRILIQARGLTLCNSALLEVEQQRRLLSSGHDPLVSGVRQIEQV